MTPPVPQPSPSPCILNVQEDGVQETGSQQPPGMGDITSGWLQQVVGQATASCGFCVPTDLGLFRFSSKCSKLGYTFLLL